MFDLIYGYVRHPRLGPICNASVAPRPCHITSVSVLVAQVPLELKLLLCKTTPLTVALGLEMTVIVRWSTEAVGRPGHCGGSPFQLRTQTTHTQFDHNHTFSSSSTSIGPSDFRTSHRRSLSSLSRTAALAPPRLLAFVSSPSNASNWTQKTRQKSRELFHNFACTWMIVSRMWRNNSASGKIMVHPYISLSPPPPPPTDRGLSTKHQWSAVLFQFRLLT